MSASIRKRYVGISLVLCFLALSPASRAQEVDPRRIMKLFETNMNSAYFLDLSAELTVTKPNNKSYETKYNLIRIQGPPSSIRKLRWNSASSYEDVRGSGDQLISSTGERLDPISIVENRRVAEFQYMYDYGKQKVVRYDQRHKQADSEDDILSARMASDTLWIHPFACLANALEIAEPREGVPTYSFGKSVSFDDSGRGHFTGERRFKSPEGIVVATRVAVEYDPAYGNMLTSIRAENSISGEEYQEAGYVTARYEKHGDIWLPSEVETHFHTSYDKKETMTIWRMKYRYVRVNTPYSDDEFSLEIPKGTRMVDRVTGMSYRKDEVPKDIENDIMKSLDMIPKALSMATTPAAQRQHDGETSTSARSTSVVAKEKSRLPQDGTPSYKSPLPFPVYLVLSIGAFVALVMLLVFCLWRRRNLSDEDLSRRLH